MMEVLPPLPLCKSDKDFIRKCVDVVVVLARLYGMDTSGWKVKGTYDHWIYCASVLRNPMKFVKWKLSSFYAFHKAQPLPVSVLLDTEIDNASCLLGGRGYKFINSIRRSDSESWNEFITSVKSLSKGMPRPNEKVVERSVRDVFTKLTTEPQYPAATLVPWATANELPSKVSFVLDKPTLEQEFKRTVNELFVGESFDWSDRIEPFFFSTSSTVINTRSMGGVVGAILDHPNILQGLKTERELISVKAVSVGSNHTFVVNDRPLRESFEVLYKRIIKIALSELAEAKLHGLAESNKVRSISKGPPFLYSVLKPLQRKLWSVLKKHPCFTLIGEPITDSYVQERMGSSLKEGFKFLSIDYSDATNELFSWCSECVIKALCENLSLDEETKDFFIRAMTEHIIILEEPIINSSGKRELLELDRLPQKRGQLMGSIMSFPILCIVNAAICRWAVELSSQRVFTLKDCPLAVNGDDGIMKVNDSGRVFWERISSFCGLSPSIGKVYFSDQFLNMNSTTFDFYSQGWEGYQVMNREGTKLVNRIRYFRLIRFINFGLLFGLKRSGLVSQKKRSPSYGAQARDLISTCPPRLRERVLCQFIHLNKSRFDSLFIPWFIPEQLGGLGLPIIGKYSPCDRDLRVARKIYEHKNMFRLPSLPLDVAWHTWEIATKRFPNIGSSINHDFIDSSHMISHKRLLGLACVEALFRVNKISDLYKSADDKTMKNVLSHYYKSLRRVWSKALLDKSVKLPEPFRVDKFPKKYTLEDVPLYFYSSLSSL